MGILSMVEFFGESKGDKGEIPQGHEGFAAYMGEREVTEEAAAQWKNDLAAKGCSPKNHQCQAGGD